MTKKIFFRITVLAAILLLSSCSFTNIVEENKYPRQDKLISIDSVRWIDPKPDSYIVKALVRVKSGTDSANIKLPDSMVQTTQKRLKKLSDAFKNYFLNRYSVSSQTQAADNVVILIEPTRLMKYVNGGKSVQISASVFQDEELIWFSIIDMFGPESISDKKHVESFVDKLSGSLKDSNIKL